jgi:endonuclease YncB( thermonuclease family)
MKKLAILVTVLAFHGPAMGQEAAAPTAFIVVDGDTIRSPAGVRYRLPGLDAPKTARAALDPVSSHCLQQCSYMHSSRALQSQTRHDWQNNHRSRRRAP